MTLETILSRLSHDEKLQAMDLLWREISSDGESYESPEWHRQVLSERLAHPAEGDSLALGAAKDEIKRRLDARRASS